MRQKFNPSNWLPEDNHSTIELIVSRIETSHTDITGSYADWRNIGFALADELAESGRDFFHRISRFYPNYSMEGCNRQFDQCLKSQGHGITIKTLFHLAKMAGVDVGRGEEEKMRGWEEEKVRKGENEKMRGWEEEKVRKGEDEKVRKGEEEKMRKGEEEKMRKGEEEKMRGWEDEKMRKGEGEKMREWEEEKVRKGEEEKMRNGKNERVSPEPSASEPEIPEVIELPTLPDSIYDGLPEILKKSTCLFKTREVRDVMLLGAIVTFSSCLLKVYGMYDDRKVRANLFLFATATASAGKGNLVLCRRLVNPIHKEQRQLSHQMKQVYEVEMRDYNLQKSKDFSLEKPAKPPEKMLFIPANNSTTGVFQLLSDNEGKGLIFETEGDTLAQAFKSDYGNYSDGFRKAFHHENISYYRRTDREFVEIEEPCLSAVLSSTPKQVSTLIPNAENGLFSRFIFYHMNLRSVWKDVLAESMDDGMDQYFNSLGQEFLPFYKALCESPEIKFCVTDEQRLQFNEFFIQLQDKYLMLKGEDYTATVRRLGLIAFRIAMVFTTLRMMETGDFTQKQVCRDQDFQAAISMVRVLVKHASHVYSQLPVEEKAVKQKDRKEQFLEMLPGKFTSSDYHNIGKSLSIPLRSMDRYIAIFCEKGLIRKEQYGNYSNLTVSDGKNIE